MKGILNWFIAQEKETQHPMVVNEIPRVLIAKGADGTEWEPSGVEWERITADMTLEQAEQLRAEILFADRDGMYYPGWGGEGYGGAGYDPSIDG